MTRGRCLFAACLWSAVGSSLVTNQHLTTFDNAVVPCIFEARRTSLRISALALVELPGGSSLDQVKAFFRLKDTVSFAAVNLGRACVTSPSCPKTQTHSRPTRSWPV